MVLEGLGKTFVIIGVLFIVIGIVFIVGKKLGFGMLPGDIFIKRGNVTFYFPIISSILLSILLTIVLNLIFRH